MFVQCERSRYWWVWCCFVVPVMLKTMSAGLVHGRPAEEVECAAKASWIIKPDHVSGWPGRQSFTWACHAQWQCLVSRAAGMSMNLQRCAVTLFATTIGVLRAQMPTIRPA